MNNQKNAETDSKLALKIRSGLKAAGAVMMNPSLTNLTTLGNLGNLTVRPGGIVAI
jgi:hypothetical protein